MTAYRAIAINSVCGNIIAINNVGNAINGNVLMACDIVMVMARGGVMCKRIWYPTTNVIMA